MHTFLPGYAQPNHPKHLTSTPIRTSISVGIPTGALAKCQATYLSGNVPKQIEASTLEFPSAHSTHFCQKSHFPLCCKLQILGLLTELHKAFSSVNNDCTSSIPPRNPASLTARPVRLRGLLSPLDRSRKPGCICPLHICFLLFLSSYLAVRAILLKVCVRVEGSNLPKAYHLPYPDASPIGSKQTLEPRSSTIASVDIPAKGMRP